MFTRGQLPHSSPHNSRLLRRDSALHLQKGGSMCVCVRARGRIEGRGMGGERSLIGRTCAQRLNGTSSEPQSMYSIAKYINGSSQKAS